jgi:hypothetical protein
MMLLSMVRAIMVRSLYQKNLQLEPLVPAVTRMFLYGAARSPRPRL